MLFILTLLLLLIRLLLLLLIYLLYVLLYGVCKYVFLFSVYYLYLIFGCDIFMRDCDIYGFVYGFIIYVLYIMLTLYIYIYTMYIL